MHPVHISMTEQYSRLSTDSVSPGPDETMPDSTRPITAYWPDGEISLSFGGSISAPAASDLPTFGNKLNVAPFGKLKTARCQERSGKGACGFEALL
ncbi:hypothetical protein CIW54_10530 [Paraburkholderia sp. T12-10]|nr:hypothetical protein CIW54_10530 [Paraburkholderia sp. T12-10]